MASHAQAGAPRQIVLQHYFMCLKRIDANMVILSEDGIVPPAVFCILRVIENVSHNYLSLTNNTIDCFYNNQHSAITLDGLHECLATHVLWSISLILEAITRALARGDRIEIRGFGSFELRYWPLQGGATGGRDVAADPGAGERERTSWHPRHALPARAPSSSPQPNLTSPFRSPG